MHFFRICTSILNAIYAFSIFIARFTLYSVLEKSVASCFWEVLLLNKSDENETGRWSFGRLISAGHSRLQVTYLWLSSQTGSAPHCHHWDPRLGRNKLQHGSQGGPVGRWRSLLFENQTLKVDKVQRTSQTLGPRRPRSFLFSSFLTPISPKSNIPLLRRILISDLFFGDNLLPHCQPENTERCEGWTYIRWPTWVGVALIKGQ